VEAGLPAIEYQKLLNEDLKKHGLKTETPALEDDFPEGIPPIADIIVPGAELPPQPERPKRPAAIGVDTRARKAPRTSTAGGVGDPPAAGSGGAPPAPPPACPGGGGDPPVEGGPAPGVESGPIVDAIVGGSVVPEAPQAQGRRVLGRDWRDTLNGAKIQYKAYAKNDGSKPYRNYIMTCTRHPGCQRTHGRIPKWMKRHGELEPLAWLHAWEAVEVPPDRAHNGVDPKDAEVDSWMETRAGDLQVLFEALTG